MRTHVPYAGTVATCSRAEMKVASGAYMLHSLARCTRPASPRHTRSYYDMHMLCSRAEVEDALLACQETDFVHFCNIIKRFLSSIYVTISLGRYILQLYLHLSCSVASWCPAHTDKGRLHSQYTVSRVYHCNASGDNNHRTRKQGCSEHSCHYE